jgi:SLT domain-containing protein
MAAAALGKLDLCKIEAAAESYIVLDARRSSSSHCVPKSTSLAALIRTINVYKYNTKQLGKVKIFLEVLLQRNFRTRRRTERRLHIAH